MKFFDLKLGALGSISARSLQRRTAVQRVQVSDATELPAIRPVKQALRNVFDV